MAGVIVCKQHTVLHSLRLLSCRQFAPCGSVLVEHVRHKGSSKRFVLPPSAKEKDKWVPRAKRAEAVETVVPPKVLERFMKRVPEDDVYIREHYPTPRYRLVDSLRMHRELASPEMLDNMDGLVVADLELDMSTKKKTKFLSAVSGTVLFPHLYDDGIENRVVAITKNSELQEEALKKGATYAGGLEVIKLIERGEIRHDDYDHVVCDMETMQEVAAIKKHLKEHFPTRKKGTLGPDVVSMVNLFVKGRTFESHRETDARSRLSLAFGKLNMSDEELSDNFQTLIDTVVSLKPQAPGKLIAKVDIRCPPSSESFRLCDSDVAPTKTAAPVQPSAEAHDEDVDDAEDEEREKEAQ